MLLKLCFSNALQNAPREMINFVKKYFVALNKKNHNKNANLNESKNYFKSKQQHSNQKSAKL